MAISIGTNFCVPQQHFGFEIYHGMTGFIMEPLRGAKKDKVKGFAKGTCRGSIGLILKPGSGKWSETV